MNDAELETLLRESAPEVTSPQGFAGHQERILRGAQSRRGRRVRVWAASIGGSSDIRWGSWGEGMYLMPEPTANRTAVLV
ncbi:MAG: hypothetical protein ABGX78_06110 [Microbacterium sp.]|uniref:hypothetical protein n=1 Tax=Microbacterium sp. TaxID=51671 RepID=UPI0032424DF9